jgi:hypothetical protein
VYKQKSCEIRYSAKIAYFLCNLYIHYLNQLVKLKILLSSCGIKYFLAENGGFLGQGARVRHGGLGGSLKTDKKAA